MNSEQLKSSTKKIGISVIKMVTGLPKSDVGRVISYQILKSSTSVGANYRAACRAKSKADFI